MAPSQPDSTADNLTYGSFTFSALLQLPAIPVIVSEWASILPIAFHLASAHHAHHIVGDVSLRGELRFGLLPRLGVLQTVAQLVEDESGFSDLAAKGGLWNCVFDVNWGGHFPSSNGGACDRLVQLATARAGPLKHLPDFVKVSSRSVGSQSSVDTQSAEKAADFPATEDKARVWRRYENLYVTRYRLDPDGQSQRRWNSPNPTKLVKLFTRTFLMLALAVCLFATGAYGSAVTLLLPPLSWLTAHLAHISVARPPGYMLSNQGTDACMLVAAHQNANLWHLFIGDRGVIDTLLNKPMVSFTGYTKPFAVWLRLAHVIQLLAMTYVASQKGFDGVFLVVIMLLERILEWLCSGERLVQRWLRENGAETSTNGFRFTGRMPLMGVIQMMSNTREDAWMDSIISKCTRRDLWLRRLECLRFHPKVCVAKASCFPDGNGEDEQWLELNTRLVAEGHGFVKKHIQ